MSRSSISSTSGKPAPHDAEFEVREDEEQAVKLGQIIELLLAAGYFRVRIKGLSPFDKVVGGVVWCISVCSYDVDIDLLFQENSTIGQKIAITEKIVGALKCMKCPQRIEPHQIQGLDFIHIFPVVQWLVKRAIETRAETGDYIRAFSVSQFNKNHTLPQDAAFNEQKPRVVDAVRTVQTSYRPTRKYRLMMRAKFLTRKLAFRQLCLNMDVKGCCGLRHRRVKVALSLLLIWSRFGKRKKEKRKALRH